MLIRKFIVMSCIVWTITGCGTTDQETASGDGTARTEESADRTDQHSGSQGETGAQGGTGSREEGAGQGETEGQETGAITVAQVKTVVLDNAGLSEEEVRFVRIHLDSENGRAEYDVEFVCRDAEYDYRVSAGTGEILAMNCEMGNYDVNTLPPDVAQAGNDPAPDSLAPDTPRQVMVRHRMPLRRVTSLHRIPPRRVVRLHRIPPRRILCRNPADSTSEMRRRNRLRWITQA